VLRIAEEFLGKEKFITGQEDTTIIPFAALLPFLQSHAVESEGPLVPLSPAPRNFPPAEPEEEESILLASTLQKTTNTTKTTLIWAASGDLGLLTC